MTEPGTDLVPTNGQPPGGNREPWEKRPKESARAFHAFAVYRDLGPYRSLAKTAQDLTGLSAKHRDDWTKTERKAYEARLRSVSEFSRKYDWGERTDLYDFEVDRRNREARETARMRMERIHAGAASAAMANVLPLLTGRDRNGQPVPRLVPESFGEAAAGFDKLVRIERMSRGMPTDLVRGAFAISATDHVETIRRVVEAMLPFVPEERHEQAILAVEELATRQGIAEG